MPRYGWLLVVLIVASAFGVYQLKHAVWRARVELRQTEAAIAKETWDVRRLEADLAFLTRPTRLADLAGRVGMRPATVERVVEARQIGRRRALELARTVVPVELVSGGRVELRFKPPVTFVLDAGEGR
ncbi:MAG: hypothetical protein KDG89_15555 [Geminicoccaceae bacterium]|nr:hypothetical protein [Geminicoccaceae bacterium]